MFSLTYYNASGYEPKPGAQLAPSSSIKRHQISDAQLKILPVFDYAGMQSQFADSLKDLFLTWRLVFLVKNVPVISPMMVVPVRWSQCPSHDDSCEYVLLTTGAAGKGRTRGVGQ